jgi:hypothetical protein
MIVVYEYVLKAFFDKRTFFSYDCICMLFIRLGGVFFLSFPPIKLVNILSLCGKSSLIQISCVSLLTRSLHPKPTRYISINFTRDGN